MAVILAVVAVVPAPDEQGKAELPWGTFKPFPPCGGWGFRVRDGPLVTPIVDTTSQRIKKARGKKGGGSARAHVCGGRQYAEPGNELPSTSLYFGVFAKAQIRWVDLRSQAGEYLQPQIGHSIGFQAPTST